MIRCNSEIGLYVDTLIVEALLADPRLFKTAQVGSLVSTITEKVKDYVDAHLDPNDKVGSLINFLGPGVIATTFGMIPGLGIIGKLLGFAVSMMHIDVAGILRSIWDKLKGVSSGDRPTTSAVVHEAVTSSVQEHSKPATQEEADAAQREAQKSSHQLLRDARFLKLAVIEFDRSPKRIKEAGWFDIFSAKKASTTNLLSLLLSWIFRIAFASAGLMVAGDVANKFLSRPSALDGTLSGGKEKPSSAPMHVATQTKFKVQPSYGQEDKNVGNTPWVEGVANNKSFIDALLVLFSKQVYQGLDGLESIIMSTPGFQEIADRITFYNQAHAGDQMVFIPKYFHNKKEMVDMFIDDVAQKAT